MMSTARAALEARSTLSTQSTFASLVACQQEIEDDIVETKYYFDLIRAYFGFNGLFKCKFVKKWPLEEESLFECSVLLVERFTSR